MTFEEFHLFAARAIRPALHASEIELRRAVSSLYYGLFHRLSVAGAEVFNAGGTAVTLKASRAFNHTEMREACAEYVKWAPGSRLASLVSTQPGQQLLTVAQAFVDLQEARHRADYDLGTAITNDEALDLLQQATFAHLAFDAVEQRPETSVFLTCLLLGKRLMRGG